MIKPDIIIKSFMRPMTLRDCVASTRLFYDNRIIVADDSAQFDSNLLKMYNVEVHRLDYDIGISAGRNYLLDQVNSSLFLLLDSDFVLVDSKTIEKLYEIMIETGCSISAGLLWDIGAPSTRNYYGYFEQDYEGNISLKYYDPIKTIFKKTFNGFRYCGCRFTENFFLGNIEDFRSNNVHWDASLKVREHEDFFIRFPNELKITTTPDVYVRHYPCTNNSKYLKFRYRPAFKKLAKKKNRFRDGGSTVFDWTSWKFPPIIR